MASDEARRTVDGRSQRRMRNEDAAVDAILELIGEGCTRPTAQQVSERSGVSIRSIFRLFQDMEALYAAAVARQTERVERLTAFRGADGSLEQRIRALVRNRSNLFEQISPVRRVALRLAPSSPVITDGLELAAHEGREQLLTVFAPELRGLVPNQRRELLDALDLVTSWEAWERLRHTQRLTVPRSRRITEGTVTALFRQAEGHRNSADPRRNGRRRQLDPAR